VIEEPLQVIEHKRGDTFNPTCTYLSSAGVAYDYTLDGITIASQVRTPAGKLVGTLTAAPAIGVGKFTLESGNTQNWPLGSLRWDIQFSQGSHIFSTRTAALLITADNTL
jgi:hypothetical protein